METPPIETLLEHRAWVRGLARMLAAGPVDADDLEQEAWMAGLRRDAPIESPRGWLAGVMRRQAARAYRGSGRRDRRERAASKPEAVASTAEIVERTETHRRVVDAVLALAEPYRTTVLLRFFEDLPPREIARRTDAPVETVRSRLRSALLDLRERFDREEQSGRRPWRAAFLALAETEPGAPAGRPGPGNGTGGAAATAAGGIAMSATTKAGVGVAAALLVGALAWWGLRDDAPDRTPPSEQGGGVRAPDALPPGETPRLVAREGGPARATPPPAPAGLPAGRAGVRVVESDAADARGVAGALVSAVREDGTTSEERTDAGGLAAMSTESTSPVVLWVSAPERATVRRTGVALVAGKEERVVLAPGARVALKFVDLTTGGDVPADEVRRRYEASGIEPRVEVVWDGLLTAGDVASIFRTMMGPERAWRTTSSVVWDDGGGRLGLRLAAGSWRLLVWTPTGVPMLTDAVRAAGSGVEIVVPLPPTTRSRRVRLLDAETGAPLPKAWLQAYFEYGDDQAFFAGPRIAVDERGELELPDMPPKRPGGGRSTFQRDPTWWAEDATHALRLVDYEMRNLPAGDVAVLKVPKTGVVTGSAFAASGEPASGRIVLSSDKGRVVRAAVGADGRFRLEGVPARTDGREVRIGLVEDLDTARVTMVKVEMAPGAVAEVTIGTPASAGPRAKVEGTITAGGKPLPNAFAMARRGNKGDAGVMGRAGADGRFRLEPLPPGSIEVMVFLCDPRVSDDFYASTGLELKDGETRTVRIDLPGGAVRVKVVDAASGEPIPGAAAMARPESREPDVTTVPGWTWRPGTAAFVGEDGTVVLLSLPTGPVTAAGYAPGYAEQETKNVAPGTADAPTEVVLRLTKKP